MGKYSGLDLPRLPRDEEGSHRENVRAFKTTIEAKTPSEFLERYAKVRRTMDAIKKQKSEIQIELDAVSEMLIDSYEEQEISSLKLENGDTLRVDLKPYPQMQGPEGRELFRQWCLGQGLEREMHLHFQTATSMVCTMLLAGDPEPPGVEAFMKEKLVFTRG